MVSYISELRYVYLFQEEMCSLCVLNELLEPFSLHHDCCGLADILYTSNHSLFIVPELWNRFTRPSW